MSKQGRDGTLQKDSGLVDSWKETGIRMRLTYRVKDINDNSMKERFNRCEAVAPPSLYLELLY